MKRILFTTFVLILSVFAYSQTILENPKVGMSTATNVRIVKIELRDSATVLWFHVNQTPGAWISVPGGSFIQPVGSKEKLYIVSTEGIKMNEQFIMPASGETSYKLFFPKLDASVGKIDFGQDNEGGSWFIYDIQLKPGSFKSVVPEKIVGNWFRSDNAQWEISLFDSAAVYKSQVWKYGKYAENNGVGKISLRNGSKVLTIYTKSISDSTCLIGETLARMVKYAHHQDESIIPADNETYKLPVFKMDTVTYCGYIKGFSPRFPQRTGMVYVNNGLNGDQDSYLIKIADDGTFKVKFVHNNPQLVLLRFASINELIFIEPGKSFFQMIDNNNQSSPSLFMGELARINMDVTKLKDTYSFNFLELEKQSQNSSLNEFKEYLLNDYTNDLSTLESLKKKQHIGAKANQVWKMELDYRYGIHFMDYANKKDKIMSIETDSSYFSFLTDDLVNNPLAILTAAYCTFVNRIMMYNYRRELSTLKLNTIPEITATLVNAGYKLTPEAKDLAIRMKDYNTPEIKKLQVAFRQKYREQILKFYQKYTNKIQSLYKEKSDSFITLSLLEDYLTQQNVVLTKEEKEFIQTLKELIGNPLAQQLVFFLEINDLQICQFYDNYWRIGMLASLISERNDKIQKVLGIPLGFASDIMASDDFCRTIIASMTPISEENIKVYQKNIGTPFISNFIDRKINESKTHIEANKKQKGSIVNEVPKTQGDKLFDTIMEKYKGKVVYVDFWATWCAPCRSGIAQIKPLKEEMADENVAFVYITNHTSPKTTYDNMIPGIKGEHYRVSADEWNVLSGMFNISGIPHCVLVGKDGKVINPHLGYHENPELKALLMKSILE